MLGRIKWEGRGERDWGRANTEGLLKSYMELGVVGRMDAHVCVLNGVDI